MPEQSGAIRYFQEAMLHNHCFGCGKDNGQGLHIRSRWDDEDPELAICEFEPLPHHSSYPVDVVNGGIIAAVIDCHSICTSIAHAYRRAGREIGEGQTILFATASLEVSYRKPTPISGPLRVVGRIAEAEGRRTRIESTVFDHAGVKTADGKVMAVQVPSAWADPGGLFAEG